MSEEEYDGCDDVLRLLRDRAASDAGFELEQQRLDLYGRCQPCLAAAGPSATA